MQYLHQILIKSRNLQHLDFGYAESLTCTINELRLLHILLERNGDNVKFLNTATIKLNLDHDSSISISPEILVSFKNLSILHLDYTQLNDGVLEAFCHYNRAPLSILHVIVQSVDTSHPGTTNNQWSKFINSK